MPPYRRDWANYPREPWPCRCSWPSRCDPRPKSSCADCQDEREPGCLRTTGEARRRLDKYLPCFFGPKFVLANFQLMRPQPISRRTQGIYYGQTSSHACSNSHSFVWLIKNFSNIFTHIHLHILVHSLGPENIQICTWSFPLFFRAVVFFALLLFGLLAKAFG